MGFLKGESSLPHYESEAKGKVFVMKISCDSYVNKTKFDMKSFAPSLAFIMRFTARCTLSVSDIIRIPDHGFMGSGPHDPLL